MPGHGVSIKIYFSILFKWARAGQVVRFRFHKCSMGKEIGIRGIHPPPCARVVILDGLRLADQLLGQCLDLCCKEGRDVGEITPRLLEISRPWFKQIYLLRSKFLPSQLCCITFRCSMLHRHLFSNKFNTAPCFQSSRFKKFTCPRFKLFKKFR